jgi:hypothetical protein
MGEKRISRRRCDTAFGSAAAAEGAFFKAYPSLYGTGTAAKEAVAMAGPTGRLRLLDEQKISDLLTRRGF